MENYTSFFTPWNSIGNLIEDELDSLIFSKNQTIYSEGNSPIGIYIIKKGKILITKTGNQGKEQVLRITHKNEMIGCSDLILQKRYTTSARTIENSNLLFMPRGVFFDLLLKNTEWNQKLIHQFASEIQNLELICVRLAYKPVRGRLADSLLNLMKRSENDDNKITLSRKELAGFTGTAKETVNRLLSEFHKENLIAMNRNEIRILEPEHIERISQMYD